MGEMEADKWGGKRVTDSIHLTVNGFHRKRYLDGSRHVTCELEVRNPKINNSSLLPSDFCTFLRSCLLCYYISVNANKINTCFCQMCGRRNKISMLQLTSGADCRRFNS